MILWDRTLFHFNSCLITKTNIFLHGNCGSSYFSVEYNYKIQIRNITNKISLIFFFFLWLTVITLCFQFVTRSLTFWEVLTGSEWAMYRTLLSCSPRWGQKNTFFFFFFAGRRLALAAINSWKTKVCMKN